MRTLVIVLLCLLVPGPLLAEEPKAPARQFPDTWSGAWSGPCKLIRHGRPDLDFPMELHVAPRSKEDGGGHTWTIVYGAGAKRQERPYVLLAADEGGHHFRIDERNSIVLDAYFENERLHNRFKVGTNVIEATYTRRGDALEVELTTFGSEPVATTGGKGRIPAVEAYRLRSVQRGTLQRAKAK